MRITLLFLISAAAAQLDQEKADEICRQDTTHEPCDGEMKALIEPDETLTCECKVKVVVLYLCNFHIGYHIANNTS